MTTLRNEFRHYKSWRQLIPHWWCLWFHDIDRTHRIMSVDGRLYIIATCWTCRRTWLQYWSN